MLNRRSGTSVKREFRDPNMLALLFWDTCCLLRLLAMYCCNMHVSTCLATTWQRWQLSSGQWLPMAANNCHWVLKTTA